MHTCDCVSVTDTDACREIVSQGGIEQIVGAMKQHSEDAGVQRDAALQTCMHRSRGSMSASTTKHTAIDAASC